MQKPGTSVSVAGVYASICAGAFAGIISCPFDAAKTCMQGDLYQHKYKGFIIGRRGNKSINLI